MTRALQHPHTRHWMAGSFCIALAIFVLSRTLTKVPGVDLIATARWSFVLFWLGSTGGALARLFGLKFAWLARRGRDFSLAYASAMLVHLAIVVRIIYTQPPQPGSEMLLFGIAVFWTYLLALLSIRKLSACLNPITWRVVRTLGVEYITFAFLVDFAKHPFDGGVLRVLNYLPFFVLAIAAPSLRFAAFVKRTVSKRSTAVPVTPALPSSGDS